MRHYFYWLCIAGVLLVSCTKNESVDERNKMQPNSLEEYNLKGPVVSVTQLDYRVLYGEEFVFSFADLMEYEFQKEVNACHGNLDEDDVFIDLMEEIMSEESDDYEPVERLIFNEKGLLTKRLTYMDDDYMEDGWISDASYQYDDYNRQTLCDEFDAKGMLVGRNMQEYDEAGNLLSTYFWQAGEPATKSESKYDEAGNILESKTTYGNQVTWHNRSVYDSNNHRIRYELLSNETGEVTNVTESDYDINGNLIEERNFRQGNLSYTHYYKYDERNNLTDDYQVSVRGDTTSYWYYSYDAQGNQTMSAYYLNDSELPATVANMTYDKHGNLLSRESFYNDDYDCSAFQYDSKGRETEVIWYSTESEIVIRVMIAYNNDGNERERLIFKTFAPNWRLGQMLKDEQFICRVVYQFDDYGNWINREEYYRTVDDEEILVNRCKRDIVYAE